MQSLRFDRPLSPSDFRFLADHNIGITVHQCCSAHYTSALPQQQAIQAIRRGLATLQRNVPALSTVVERHPDTNQLCYFQIRDPTPPTVPVVTADDLDPTSLSFQQIVQDRFFPPFEIGPGKHHPMWRAYIVTCQKQPAFEARVLFVLSHVLMDGLCGPFLHEQLSELLCDPGHPLSTQDTEPTFLRMPPALEDIWDMRPSLAQRLSSWFTYRIAWPCKRFFLGLWNRLDSLNPWLLGPRRHCLETLMFDRSFMDKLLVQARSHGVTPTNMLGTSMHWALRKTLVELADPRLAPEPIDFHCSVTCRPGYSFGKGARRGPGYAAVTRPHPLLPIASAFNRRLCAVPMGIEFEADFVRPFWAVTKGYKNA